MRAICEVCGHTRRWHDRAAARPLLGAEPGIERPCYREVGGAPCRCVGFRESGEIAVPPVSASRRPDALRGAQTLALRTQPRTWARTAGVPVAGQALENLCFGHRLLARIARPAWGQNVIDQIGPASSERDTMVCLERSLAPAISAATKPKPGERMP